jgi:hypothetical protein
MTRDGTAVEIGIYDYGEGGWLLEIVDESAIQPYGTMRFLPTVLPSQRH